MYAQAWISAKQCQIIVRRCRVSGAAESQGAVSTECGVEAVVTPFIRHIKHLRSDFDKTKKELKDMKSLLKEYKLMEDSETPLLPKQRTVSSASTFSSQNSSEDVFKEMLESIEDVVEELGEVEEDPKVAEINDIEDKLPFSLLTVGVAASSRRSSLAVEKAEQESLHPSSLLAQILVATRSCGIGKIMLAACILLTMSAILLFSLLH